MALSTATIIKGTVGVLGVSSLGVGGYYGIQALNKETIENKLNAEGLKKLSKTSSEWGDIFKSYQIVSTTNSVLKFSGKDITNAKELQERCEEVISKDSFEDNATNNYLKNAKKWCIVPTTVKDGLKDRKILRTDDSKDNEDQNDWNEKIKSYTKTENSNKIKALDFTGSPISSPTPTNRNLIRKKCKALIEKKNYAEDYEEALKNSEDWCSIAK